MDRYLRSVSQSLHLNRLSLNICIDCSANITISFVLFYLRIRLIILSSRSLLRNFEPGQIPYSNPSYFRFFSSIRTNIKSLSRSIESIAPKINEVCCDVLRSSGRTKRKVETHSPALCPWIVVLTTNTSTQQRTTSWLAVGTERASASSLEIEAKSFNTSTEQNPWAERSDEVVYSSSSVASSSHFKFLTISWI